MGENKVSVEISALIDQAVKNIQDVKRALTDIGVGASGADKVNEKTALMKKNLDAVISSAQGVATQFGIWGAAGVMALDKLYKGQTANAAQIIKTSKMLGISTDETQKLKYATDMSDTSFESLGVSIGILSRNLVEARGGNKSLRDDFKRTGIEYMDTATGKVRPALDVLMDFAEWSKSSGASATEKLASAQMLLGRGAREIVPFLSQGKEGIRALFAEAEKSGAIIDPKTLESVHELENDFKRFAASMKGPLSEMLVAAGPAIKDFLGVAKGALEVFNNLPDWAKKGAMDVLVFGSAFGVLAGTVGKTGFAVADLIRNIAKLTSLGGVANLPGIIGGITGGGGAAAGGRAAVGAMGGMASGASLMAMLPAIAAVTAAVVLYLAGKAAINAYEKNAVANAAPRGDYAEYLSDLRRSGKVSKEDMAALNQGYLSTLKSMLTKANIEAWEGTLNAKYGFTGQNQFNRSTPAAAGSGGFNININDNTLNGFIIESQRLSHQASLG